HREHIEAEGTLDERRARNLRNEVLELAASRMRRRLEAAVADDSSIRELLDRVVRRELDPATAAQELLEREDGWPRPGARARARVVPSQPRSGEGLGRYADRRPGGEDARPHRGHPRGCRER